ncbi:MAG: amidohydrolase family protein [Lautropia sp.]
MSADPRHLEKTLSSSAWHCACTTRRRFLSGVPALAAAGALPGAARSQPAAPRPAAIDVHHHIYPPAYTRSNIQRIVADIGVAPPPFYLNWSAQAAIDRMDQAGVATAINSMSSPGVWFGDGEAGRARARECNEFGAKLIQDYPGRFGMFAALPLPDIDGSLREIAYALDELKLDGVGLLSSYESVFIGAPEHAPVFEELNRRRAVVFVHPTLSCCINTVPGVAPPILEFPFAETRAIANLLVSGTLGRYRDIRFVFTHGGGGLLPVANRLDYTLARMPPERRAVVAPDGALAQIRRQFFELASIGMNAAGLEGLRKLMPTTQLLYGSDEPFTSTVANQKSLTAALPADEWARIRRDNALALFPRLRA